MPTGVRPLSGVDSITSRIAQIDASLQRLATPDGAASTSAGQGGFASALQSAGQQSSGSGTSGSTAEAVMARAVQVLPSNAPLASLYNRTAVADPSSTVTSVVRLPVSTVRGMTTGTTMSAATTAAGTSTAGVTPLSFPTIGTTSSTPSAAPSAPSAPASSIVDTYLPTQVTETDSARWQDCAFSAAAMLIDDMSHGDITVTHQALRAASGIPSGGVKLPDVQRAVSRTLGIRLVASPAEQTMTWPSLLERLESGNGAVLVGSYSKLPDQFTRWDPKFAAKGPARSGHALFVGAYDRATDQIWVQDPLAPTSFKGEWVPRAALQDFSWTNSDGVVSVLTAPSEAVV